MDEILELRQKIRDLVAQMQPLAALQTLTDEQQTEYDDLRAQVNTASAQLKRLEEVHDMQARIQVVEPTPRPAPEPQAAPRPAAGQRAIIENPGFANVGELVATLRFKPYDPRIQALQEMQVGDSGGFAIPTEHDPMIREVSPQEAIFRPRATVIPAGDAPDAELRLPALNQTGAGQNMYGGVAVDWVAEGGAKPETGIKLREITWKPKEVSAHIVVTDKLLRNWAAASTFISTKLRAALLAAEDVAFQSGNGVNRPLGVLNSPALKKVNRALANKIAYADLVNMEAEFLEDGPSVWVVSKRAIPQLRVMEDSAGSLIWNDSARDGGIPTLLGRPVQVSFRSPALGSLGDVQLMDPKHYIIKDGFGVAIAASEHVHFVNNKTVVKAFLTVDGGPWLDGPVQQEDGQTYSPFVALDVPA